MIKSIQKAILILKILSNTPFGCVSLKQISENSGIEKSTCHHILETLCAEGFVQKASSNGEYMLGPDAYLLTRFGKYNENLISLCHPVLLYLARKTSKAALLAVLANNQKLIIDKIDLKNEIYKHNAQIFTDDIYRTATGRILLSHLPQEKIYEIYNKYGLPKSDEWEGIKSFDELLSALKIIKRQKYIYTVSNTKDDLCYVGLGKAIIRGDKCVGAIGLAFAAKSNENSYSLSKDELNTFLFSAAEINRRLKMDAENTLETAENFV